MSDSLQRDTTFRFKEILEHRGSLRDVGAFLRSVIINLWETYDVVYLDFENETVASGSIFDELTKLFEEFPKEEVKRRLKFVNIDPWDESLIVHLARLRLDRQTKPVEN